MDKSKILRLSPACIVLLTPAMAWSQNAQNGAWWKHLSREEKVAFVIGYWSGIADEAELASVAEAASLPKDYNKGLVDYLIEYHQQLAVAHSGSENATAGQIVDGVDALYRDYKNQLIPARITIRVALQAIAGKSNESVQSLLESQRKRFATTPEK